AQPPARCRARPVPPSVEQEPQEGYVTEVAIIGAGMAGLAAARTLSQSGVRCTLFDAAERVGGVVRSEQHGEITVDRGLQVFNTWYPAVREILNPGEHAALSIKNSQPASNTAHPAGAARC